MALRNWLNIPLIFLLAILAAIVFKSLVFGIVITVAYLFYMASLPETSTRSHAALLPVAFVIISLLIWFDEGTQGTKDITLVGFMLISLVYTLGSFCILSPLKMLPMNNWMRYSIILLIACLFANIHQKPGEGISHVLENMLLYSVYLSAVYGLSTLAGRKKVLPDSSTSI